MPHSIPAKTVILALRALREAIVYFRGATVSVPYPVAETASWRDRSAAKLERGVYCQAKCAILPLASVHRLIRRADAAMACSPQERNVKWGCRARSGGPVIFHVVYARINRCVATACSTLVSSARRIWRARAISRRATFRGAGAQGASTNAVTACAIPVKSVMTATGVPAMAVQQSACAKPSIHRCRQARSAATGSSRTVRSVMMAMCSPATDVQHSARTRHFLLSIPRSNTPPPRQSLLSHAPPSPRQ